MTVVFGPGAQIPVGPTRTSKTVTFAGAAGSGLLGTVAVATIGGEVLIERMVPVCVTDLVNGSGGGTPSVSLGVTSAATLFVAATDPTVIDAGEFWTATTPVGFGVALPATMKDIVVTENVIATITSTQAVVAQVDTLLLQSKAASTSGDYIVVTAQSGLTFALAVDKTLAAEVATLTYATKAATTSGDYVVVTAQDLTTFAVALDKTLAAEVATLTFPDVATAVGRDYFVVTSQSGLTFAIYLDKTGSEVAPTGAAYTAVAGARKSKADISADTTNVEVAARVELALNALTGFTALITTNDTAADGTMTLTQVTKGAVADPVPHNLDDTGAGTISVAITTAGANAVTPTGAAYVAATYKVVADITGDSTAAQVAARAETAWNTLTGFTAKVTTNDTAADGTMTFTQATKGAVADPVPHDAADGGAGSTGVAITTAGANAVTPSGAIYTAITASRKAVVDITGATSAADVAALFETAFNALTGFTALITTNDGAADGHLALTQAVAGAVAVPVPHNTGDTGAGGITTAATTPGFDVADIKGVASGVIRVDFYWRPLSADGSLT